MILIPTAGKLSAQTLSPVYDSAVIKKVQPTKEQEDKIFSDSKLEYKQKTVAGKGLFSEFLEWLSELVFGDPSYENISAMRKIIIWTIVIISIIVVVWLLLKSEMVSLIRPKPKAASFNFSDITEDLSSINFDTKIQSAFDTGDYRLAIRWQYLRMLYLLDKKQLIIFSPYKTNIDYSYELKEKQLRSSFLNLSRIYEYVWYGQFAVNLNAYNSNASEFESVKNQIGV